MRVLSDIKVRLPRTIGNFTHNDATGGIIMMVCIVLALILQNGSYSTSYRHGIEMSAGVVFGDFQLIKPLLLWINDGLITIFFFSIGLQLKIEFVKGNLSNPRNIILPALAAMGGILTPALVFTLFNHDNAYAMNGWAIPTSTDTAFSVAILLLLGSRVPASLKILLLSTSVFDDMGAMMILAIFYTTELSTSALVLAAFAVLCLVLLNYFGVGRRVLYLIFGLILWFAILKSGVHPTLAGIITAFLIPMKSADGQLMVEPISDSLKVWVALFVLPLFTLANAGIDLSMMDITSFFAPVSLGIFFALTIGKPIGIFLVIWLAIKVRLVKQPVDANMVQIYGMCTLTGIGFSMAFFYDSLAYQGSSVFNYADALAILVASFVSGIYGYLFLRFVACRTAAIEYRPWLPSPSGYKGTARTANLYTLDKSAQGPASVAPTAALVAEANARAAAAAAAAKAADEAALAAKQAAEAAKQAAELDDEADEETLAKVQLAAATAAKAAASAAVSTAKLDESDEVDTAEVAEAALEVATAATQVAQEIVAESSKEDLELDESQVEDSKDTEDKSHSEQDKSLAKKSGTKSSEASSKVAPSSSGKASDKSAPKAQDSAEHKVLETEDKKLDKKLKEDSKVKDEDDLDKKSSVLTSVATKAIAKVVSSIISEKENEAKDESLDSDNKLEKANSEAKSSKKSASTTRVEGQDNINEVEDNGPKTVIAVNSVGFAKVQPLLEDDKSSSEADTNESHENNMASSDHNSQESQVHSDSDHKQAVAKSVVSGELDSNIDQESETKSASNEEQESVLVTDDNKTSQDHDSKDTAQSSESDQEDTHSEQSEVKKTEKKAKSKSKPDFDSDIYLSEVVGSVAAQVEKIAEEKAKTKKTVNVAELIAKAKTIEEAMQRESDKSKSEKSDTSDKSEPSPKSEQAPVTTPSESQEQDAKDSALDPSAKSDIESQTTDQSTQDEAQEQGEEAVDNRKAKGHGLLSSVLSLGKSKEHQALSEDQEPQAPQEQDKISQEEKELSDTAPRDNPEDKVEPNSQLASHKTKLAPKEPEVALEDKSDQESQESQKTAHEIVDEDKVSANSVEQESTNKESSGVLSKLTNLVKKRPE